MTFSDYLQLLQVCVMKSYLFCLIEVFPIYHQPFPLVLQMSAEQPQKAAWSGQASKGTGWGFILQKLKGIWAGKTGRDEETTAPSH